MLCKKVGIFPQKIYKHSSIYAVNVGTQNNPQKQKPRKSKLLSSIKGEENRIEFQTPVNWKLRKIKTAEIKECLYVVCSLGFWTWAYEKNVQLFTDSILKISGSFLMLKVFSTEHQDYKMTKETKKCVSSSTYLLFYSS